MHLNRNLEPSYSFIFQLTRTGQDAVLIENYFKQNNFKQNNSIARAGLEDANSARKSCTTESSASQDAW